jgi:hypothetical protein
MRFEIDNLTSANQNLKSQLDDATTLLNTIRHSLGAQPGETALDTVNRVVALYQDRAEKAETNVRLFKSRNTVLGNIVLERTVDAGRINALEAALSVLQFAAFLVCETDENLKRVLIDTLKIHNDAPEEFKDLKP